MKKRLVIKLGGKLLDRQFLEPFVKALSCFISKNRIQVCLVHGGGDVLDQWLSAFGYHTEKKQGVRCTPEEQIPVVRGALAGFCNTELSGMLFRHSLSAVGLTLADAFTSRVISPEKYRDFGKVAEAVGNDGSLLDNLLNHQYIPVLSSIAHDPENGWFNINADQAATAIASLVNADQLWLLSDIDGVMDESGNPVSHIHIKKSGPIHLPPFVKDGMHVKLMSAARLVRASSCRVIIGNGQCQETLDTLFDCFLLNDKNTFRRRCGTCIDSY